MRWNPKIGTSSQEGDMDVRWMSIREGEATGNLMIDHFIKQRRYGGSSGKDDGCRRRRCASEL